MSEHVVSDFKGKDDLLIQSIDALLDMDAKGILVPHGIGGHARTLLLAAKAAIEQAARTVPEGYVVVPVEPTSDMVCAAIDAGTIDDDDVLWVWGEMLSAAPEGEK